MKANSLARGLRPLLLIAAATQVAALPRPEILHREVEKDGLHLTVDVTQGQGPRRQVLLMTTLENRGERVLVLPGGPRENGLSFSLRDPQERLLEDAAPPSPTEEVRLLPPGGKLRSVLELGARPLRRPGQERLYQGLAADELAFLPYLDLEVRQLAEAGALRLEVPTLRIWSNPYVLHPLFLRQAAAFGALHGPGAPSLEQPAYVAGELLVGFREGVPRVPEGQEVVEAEPQAPLPEVAWSERDRTVQVLA